MRRSQLSHPSWLSMKSQIHLAKKAKRNARPRENYLIRKEKTSVLGMMMMSDDDNVDVDVADVLQQDVPENPGWYYRRIVKKVKSFSKSVKL